ncbi:uncharacterized protein LOC119950948 isoform X2 [Scyliorhinus canicula]|uniref:uncharacterized protein LOC119950948 isoform X2 n=1 Tax=Scyliorhinus canicula TaxID=7830 RepID=UPI0018F692F4|nr:uncharacterized protein LOC119950948 isoform X2 [Scyliorhinus canicula]
MLAAHLPREMSRCPSHQYQKNGNCCDKCPAGYKKIKDCHGNEKTKCEQCKADEYLDYPNYTNYCIRCSYCEEGSNLVTAAHCSPTANTQCQCKSGYYCSSRLGKKCERCRKLTKCGPGKGVIEKATGNSDSVCGPCPSGNYSNVTDSISPCQRHTHCALIGQYILIPGTAIADSICTSILSTSERPSAVTTSPNYPNRLLFTAIAIIATLVYVRKRRKRTANIGRMEHHTTEMMDELLQLRVVKIMLDKSEEVVESVMGLREHSPARTEDVSKENNPLKGVAADYCPLQSQKPTLYAEVIRGSRHSELSTPVYGNLLTTLGNSSCTDFSSDSTNCRKKPTLSISEQHLIGVTTSRGKSRSLQICKGQPDPRPHCDPEQVGRELREVLSLHSLSSDDPDYCNLETDSAVDGPPPLPDKVWGCAPVLPCTAGQQLAAVGQDSAIMQTEAQSLKSTHERSQDYSHQGLAGAVPAASHVQSGQGPPTMTASEIFNSGNRHTTLGPLAILISPPNPEWCRRPESDGGLGGTGGGGFDTQQLIGKSVSCPSQVGKHPSGSNLQPEEDEWTG